MPSSPQEILKQYWGHDSFRPMQEDIIQNILDGRDTLALLPTGGGKSICFQVPALIKEGLCLVISPLIALMKDQVENLQKKDIPAIAIHSGMTAFEVNRTLQEVAIGDYKFLYVSPERLETALFAEWLPSFNINLLAVDEAHCISQWGYDFRPHYLRIANLRKDLPGVPVLALTASATPIVQDDIVKKLLFKNSNIFRQSFERANLSYSVFTIDSKINKAIEILSNVPGSSIVYCRNRRQTKNIAHLLSLQNISAGYYHAGLTQEERNTRQTAWVNDELRVMVCTNAFGMGIDKPGVRTVIHYDTPDCLENYYQEAGRAGRDGDKAYAVLLCHIQDILALEAMPGIRFPSIADIRKVYQSIADYLQVPIGIGEGNYYDFDLNEFIKNFKLDIHLVLNTFKVLEQEGHLAFTENIFFPSKIQFIVDKDVLMDFEQGHPALEPIIKCLLRTYQGIYDNSVSVYEKQVARLTRQDEETVNNQLLQLQSFDIIEYLPQKESPQVHFLWNRAPAQSLHINHESYQHRKQQFKLRVDAMLKYIRLDKECRSKYISGYFGDNALQRCGVCDNCLKEKTVTLNSDGFKKIEQLIYANIPEKGIGAKELLHSLAEVQQENAWEVIEFLQRERKLKVDERGLIHLSI